MLKAWTKSVFYITFSFKLFDRALVSAGLQQTAHFPNILLLFQHSEVAEKFPDPRIIIFLLFSLTLTLEISGSRG